MYIKTIYHGHADEAPGEFRIRRCGCYWKYCNGCCNSCPDGKCYTTNNTTTLSHGSYVSDSTAPSGYLDPGYPYRNLNSTSEYNHR